MVKKIIEFKYNNIFLILKYIILLITLFLLFFPNLSAWIEFDNEEVNYGELIPGNEYKVTVTTGSFLGLRVVSKGWFEYLSSATNNLFLPIKTKEEFYAFRDNYPDSIIYRYYYDWYYNPENKNCTRTRTVKIYNRDGSSYEIQQTEYARIDSTYARWNPSTGTRITGDAARWTSCRRCGWLKALWCCDWEYCAINGGKSGSCSSGDNGSCCNWQDSCDGCRNRCENSDKANRYCSSNSATC